MATPTKARSTTGATVNKATGGKPSSGAAGKTVAPAAAPGNLFQRLFAPPPVQTGPGARPQQPGMGRFFFGMMVYLLAAQVLQIGLTYFDLRYKWGLEKQVLFTAPILGKVTTMAMIFIVVLIGLLWALYHFNILPRNNLAAQRAAQAGKATPAGKAAPAGKAVVNAKTAVKNAPLAAAARTGKIAVPAGKTTTVTPAAASENDDLYERIKSQQRAQARKQRRK